VGGLCVVTKGAAEGERVVVEGVQKLADGAAVVPKPAPEAAPGPGSSGAPATATVVKN
jgi:hypothetical protein